MTQRNDQRDEQILRHLALYRISFRVVLSRRFFHGRTPGNVLTRLTREGRIQSRAGLPGRVRYYQLTTAQAERMGVPMGRARPPKPQAFLSHLAVLWHCCMDRQVRDRRRLDREEMAKLFGARPPRGVHVMQAGDSPRVYRALVPGAGRPARSVFKALRRRVLLTLKSQTLGPWVRNRHYAFLVLVVGESRRHRLMEFITRHGLSTRAVIELAPCPDHRTLADSIRHEE
jgi:hypothetical protein